MRLDLDWSCVFLSIALVVLGCDEGDDRDCRNDGLGCTAGYLCRADTDDRYVCLLAPEEETVDPASFGDAEPQSGVSGMRSNELPDEDTTATATEPVEENAGPEPEVVDPEESAAAMSSMNPSDGSMNATPSGGVTTLQNFSDDCRVAGLLGPSLPREANHFAAVTVTPRNYPFQVDRIKYDLMGRAVLATCDATLPHKVNLFVTTGGGMPPADPARDAVHHRTYDATAQPTSQSQFTMELILPIPLILEAGQSLTVSVQVAAAGSDHLCLARCEDEDAPVNTEWWSGAAEVPYQWQDLIYELDIAGAMFTRVIGNPLSQP